MKRLGFALGALLTLSGCEKPIGSYQIDKVALVPGSESAALGYYLQDTNDKVIRIAFSSETDAVAAAGSDLYVHGDTCPANGSMLYILGPYPDGQPKDLRSGGRRHPTRDAAGRYHYVAYLSVTGTGGKDGKGYDLRHNALDLCLRLDGSYMFSSAPRSETFVLPAATLTKVLQGY
jgi:hypothetical protein